MKRTLWSASLFLILAGCQMPEERLPAPLPETGKASVTYAELLGRARAQGTFANETFYKDRWNDLEDAARGLEQTARFMSTAEDVPAGTKEAVVRVSRGLNSDAQKLKVAAIDKNVEEVTGLMKRINVAVRELRVAP